MTGPQVIPPAEPRLTAAEIQDLAARLTRAIRADGVVVQRVGSRAKYAHDSEHAAVKLRVEPNDRVAREAMQAFCRGIASEMYS